MNRFKLLKTIQADLKDRLVICNIGLPSQELYKIKDQTNYFYMLGSMGLASSIGLGLALSQKKRCYKYRWRWFSLDEHEYPCHYWK